MSRMRAAITAVAGYVPEDILSNQDLEKIVDTNDEWITSRTGIKERRILKKPDTGTSYICIKAAQKLIEKKGISPDSIDMVLVTTTTPDHIVANTAAYVASEIGAVNAFGYDLSAACSGFVYGLSTASAYIESGRYKRILVVGADKMSSIIDYNDRATCIIFGDGGGAALIEPNDEGYGFQDEYLRSDGVGRDYLRVEIGGSKVPISPEMIEEGKHFLHQDGRTVFKYAVSNMADAALKVLDKNNMTKDDVDWLLPHQANKRIIDAITNRLDLEEEKVLVNIHKYGNTTNGTIPLLLSDFEHKFKKGDKLLIAAFGGGFTWGAQYITWAY